MLETTHWTTVAVENQTQSIAKHQNNLSRKRPWSATHFPEAVTVG